MDTVHERRCTQMHLVTSGETVIGPVIDAATTVLSPSEVVGSLEFARRVAGYAGVPNIDRTVAILKAAGPSNHEVHMLQGGTSRRRMYRRYIGNLSGRPGHFFSRRMGNFDKFIAEHEANCRAIGTRMRANLQLDRPQKKESVNQ